MKKIACEMCGSNDLLKNNGVFECQNCGTKYTLEEARKMMVEGVVNVEGTVTLDNSSYVKKYLQNARRAKQKEDWEETEKYYNMVEQNDPNNIEAIFYSAYAKAKTSLIDDDVYKRQAAFKVLNNCISIIDDKYSVDKKEENEETVNHIADDLVEMISSNFVFTEWKNGYGVVTRTNKNETYKLFGDLVSTFRQSINNIETIDDQIYIHEAAIRVYKAIRIIGINERELKNWVNVSNGFIDEENKKIDKIKKQKYWAKHPDEKKELELEIDKDTEKIKEQVKKLTDLKQERQKIDEKIEEKSPNAKELEKLYEKFDKLEDERIKLGLFQIKERQKIQEKSDKIEEQIEDVKIKSEEEQEKVKAKYQKKIDDLEDKIKKVDDKIDSINTKINEKKEKLGII